MHVRIAIMMVCGALAACGSKKTTSSETQGPLAIDKPPPVWETPPPPTPPPPPSPRAPALVARPVTDAEAVTLVTTWLDGIDAHDAAPVAAVMAEDIEVIQVAYPGHHDCPDEVMKSSGAADLERVARCVVAVMADGAKELEKSLKKAQVTSTISDGWDDRAVEAFARVAGAPVFVALSADNPRDGIMAEAVVAVVGSADGPRIRAAYTNITLSDD